MKILLVSTSSGSRGGGEIFLRHLGAGLAELGHEPVLWASDSSELDELCESFKAVGKVVRSAYTNTYQRRLRGLWPNSTTAITELWKSLAPDIIHINKQNLEDGLDLMDAASRTGIPATAIAHITQTMWELEAAGGAVRDRMARRRFSRWQGGLATSGSVRAESFEKFTGRAVAQIYNGVPVPNSEELAEMRAKLRRELGWKEGEVGFVSVGRLVSQKDPRRWLELVHEISRSIPQSRFAWVGDGEMRDEIQQKVAEAGLSDRVHFAGWQSDIDRWFSAGDVFLHTAAFEGLPLAVLAAMGCGLACVLPSYLLDEAKVIDPDTVISLETSEIPSEQLAALASEDRRAELGRRAQECYALHFSLPAMTQSYLDHYNELRKRQDHQRNGPHNA